MKPFEYINVKDIEVVGIYKVIDTDDDTYFLFKFLDESSILFHGDESISIKNVISISNMNNHLSKSHDWFVYKTQNTYPFEYKPDHNETRSGVLVDDTREVVNPTNVEIEWIDHCLRKGRFIQPEKFQIIYRDKQLKQLLKKQKL